MSEKKCDNENDVCYAVWHIDSNGTRVIEIQGCWSNIATRQTTCEQDQCINSRQHSAKYFHRFCCCTGNMCNVNMTESVYINQNTFSIENAVTTSNNTTLIVALKSERLWIVVLIISIPMIVSLIYVALCRSQLKPEPRVVNVSLPNPKYSTDLLNVDNLKLCSMIGQGKYGSVWKGMINEQTVAVKIFPSQYKEYFLNEKDIYCTPLMDMPYFLEYFGCDERRTLDDNIEYLLVLSLAPFGCLQEWLIQNTASFDVYIGMTRSIANGLTHLHTQLTRGSLDKPSIVHRDFNSRNILVKSDLTCVISDFGFALKTFGPRYEWKGEMTLAEQKSVNEVGTVRYLAPEMLEGAVNLRDCESALKQVDIYSFGLVLWELFTRCHEFYPPDESVLPYKQPYEVEVGKIPSLEQMQILVSRQKVRPKFPGGWKRNIAAKIAKDTSEECWDHDPDARLTALCVEERLREISAQRLQSTTTNATETRTIITTVPQTTATTTVVKEGNENLNYIGTISNGTTTSSTDDMNLSQANASKFPKLHLQGNGWMKIKSLIQKKINLQSKRNDEMSILVEDNKLTSKAGESQPPTSIFQQSNLIDNNRVHIRTKHLPQIRPKNLDLALPHINAPDTILLQPDVEFSNTFRNYQSMYKRPPSDFSSQQFTIIDEAEHPSNSNTNVNRLKKPSGLVVSKSANAVKNLQNPEYSDEWHLKRQRSLEVFRDVFGVKGSVERLRDPSERIKTPGDVPKSVRKVRASKTLSLYDDRMMNGSSGTL